MDVSNVSPLIFFPSLYHHLLNRKQPFSINQIDGVAWKSGHTSRHNKLTNLRFNLKSKINYHELISHDINWLCISFLIIWANIKIVQNREDIFWKLKGWRKNMGMTFRSMHVIWVKYCINKVTRLKFSLNSKTFMHLYWHDNLNKYHISFQSYELTLK